MKMCLILWIHKVSFVASNKLAEEDTYVCEQSIFVLLYYYWTAMVWIGLDQYKKINSVVVQDIRESAE